MSPDLSRGDLPHWADPDDYDRPVEDERPPDAPGDGTHRHSLITCAHYEVVGGDEIVWCCGKLPMFSVPPPHPFDRIAATARAALAATTPDLAENPLVTGPLLRILAIIEEETDR